MWERIKRSAFGEKYLSEGPLINFLRRVKHFTNRVLRRLKSMIPRERHFDNLVSDLNAHIGQGDIMIRDSDEEIDIIVPVFNGYEYLCRLLEDLHKTRMKCRYILVDDKSTDSRVLQLEQEFARNHGNCILLENEKNLGFVKSVNYGLSISRNHVALINTDTELPEGWLERLMYPVLYLNRVASSTPYTNSGTIFSFPNFCYNNAIYRGRSVEVIDSWFRKMKPCYTQVPTGMGFCMGMNKHAIKEIGVLDDETFGRGFGEENDWCQRAIKHGYRNVQVENLFVYHKHGGSFGSEEKEALIQDHLKKLNKRYPSYDSQVTRYIHKDPNRKLRQLVQMIIDTQETTSILYFDHSLGGGATSYLNAQKEIFVNNACCVSIVRYNIKNNNYLFVFESDSMKLEYEFQNIEDLLEIGRELHFDEIYINELVTYPGLWETQRQILNLRKQQNSRLIMLFHDFFAICPTINLLNTHRSYCGMPGQEDCEQCYLQKGWSSQYSCKSRGEWVLRWKQFLEQCTEVRTFSQDSFQRVSREFGDGLALTVVPHKVDYLFPVHKECKTTDTLNIGLLGVLAIHKGSDFIKELLREIDKQNRKVKVKLIGCTEGVDFKNERNFQETGKYHVSQLPQLIYENDIDLFLISSVWPETFSYTAEEIIIMGMPVACFDLGAPAERVKSYEKGLILNQKEPSKVLENLEQFAAEKLEIWEKRTEYKRIVYVVEYKSFSSRYRIEHMQETLLYQGVPGEIWEKNALPADISWSQIGAMVIYRCRYTKELGRRMEEARGYGIPVFYDIDDYIFEYDAIKDLSFMKSREYQGFEQYSSLICQCMEACDAIMVSTGYLKQVVQKSFPGKPVLVNRNVASAQMLILSAMTQSSKKPQRDKFVLGYFSGSNTHGQDFEDIAQILLEFMKKHENSYLKMVGCLELPKELKCVQERILTEGFMPWQELPKVIASVDVNLMPLEDTFFHRCKSENKWMEAALVKVPTVGSYNEEIANATKPGENILLCRTKEEWMCCLERLYGDADFRKELAQNAFDYVVNHKTTLCKNVELLDFVVEKKV